MAVRVLSPEAVVRMTELAKSNYRPKAIADLKAEIDGDTRAAALRLSVTRVVDRATIAAIVQKKLQLDALYAAWAEGEIE